MCGDVRKYENKGKKYENEQNKITDARLSAAKTLACKNYDQHPGE
jgi:hypothetical protein